MVDRGRAKVPRRSDRICCIPLHRGHHEFGVRGFDPYLTPLESAVFSLCRSLLEGTACPDRGTSTRQPGGKTERNSVGKDCRLDGCKRLTILCQLAPPRSHCSLLPSLATGVENEGDAQENRFSVPLLPEVYSSRCRILIWSIDDSFRVRASEVGIFADNC